MLERLQFYLQLDVDVAKGAISSAILATSAAIIINIGNRQSQRIIPALIHRFAPWVISHNLLNIEELLHLANKKLKIMIWLLVGYGCGYFFSAPSKILNIYLALVELYFLLSLATYAIATIGQALSRLPEQRLWILVLLKRSGNILRINLSRIIWLGFAIVATRTASISFLQTFNLFAWYGIWLMAIWNCVQVVNHLIDIAAERFLELEAKSESQKQQRLTITPIFNSVAKWLTRIAGVITGLYSVGIDPSPLLGFSGLAIAIFGFWGRNLGGDVFSGLAWLGENYGLIGDWLVVKTHSDQTLGCLIKITLRSVWLRDKDGYQHIIPHAQIIGVVQQLGVIKNEIFISYSHLNSDFVEKIAKAFYKSGQDPVWIDKEDIRAAERWRKAIYDGIDNCKFVIICLSPAWLSSKECRHEYEYAKAREVKIVPIIIESLNRDDVPEMLRDLNWISFHKEGIFNRSMLRLKQIVNQLENTE